MASKGGAVRSGAFLTHQEALRQEANDRFVQHVGDHIDEYLGRCLAPWQRMIKDLQTKAAALEQRASGLTEADIAGFAKAVNDHVFGEFDPLAKLVDSLKEKIATLEKRISEMVSSEALRDKIDGQFNECMAPVLAECERAWKICASGSTFLRRARRMAGLSTRACIAATRATKLMIP
jgi:uncharacterized protein YydD (DUF2326 family)